VYLPGLRVAATILVDGFVTGAWTTERVKQTARLVISPCEALSKPLRAELTEEGERLLRFIEPDTTAYEVGFAD
jgi:hypothetical protein